MSRKRQRDDDTECAALVRAALAEYIIDDLVSMIVDDYMPVVHWFHGKSRDPDIWVKLNCRCSIDCKDRDDISVEYKYKASEQGPFRLQTFVSEWNWVGDLGLSRAYRLGFGPTTGTIAVTMQQKADKVSEVLLDPIQQTLKGKAIDSLLKQVIECVMYAQI